MQNFYSVISKRKKTNTLSLTRCKTYQPIKRLKEQLGHSCFNNSK